MHFFFKFQFLSCSESDLLHCSNPTEGVDCEKNWSYENCGQVPNAKFQNFGCKHRGTEGFDYFECTNRMDKAKILFETPLVPTKKSRQAPNYNQILNYNSTHILCGERNISYQDFEDLYKKFGQEECQLKHNKSMTMSQLPAKLIYDFSFEFSDTLDKFQ